MVQFLRSKIRLTVLAGAMVFFSFLLSPATAEASPLSYSLGFISSPAASQTPLAVLPGLKGVFTGTSPEVGVHDGELDACPSTPNCVVSQTSEEDEHAIAPIAYESDRETARDLLLQVLSVVPRTEVVEQADDYIRVESSSRLMGFVDDGEFYFPADENVIQVRYAARLGESDLGVNRRRVEQIRLAMADLGA